MSDRITHLDLIRGVAVMGILTMNMSLFGLEGAGYYDLSAAGSYTRLDWFFGVLGESLSDQKFMGIFSALFGASALLFLERAERRSQPAVRLNLRRNIMLLGMGCIHSLFWEGDILIVYALCAPLLLLARRWAVRRLIIAGVSVFSLAIIANLWVSVNLSDDAIRNVWLAQVNTESDILASLGFMIDIFSRSLGAMLIGMGLYRSGALTTPDISRRQIQFGVTTILTGGVISALGVWWTSAQDFKASSIIIGGLPNQLVTIPMTIGYIIILKWWNIKPESALIRAVRALGRMALTNYLSQTALAMFIISCMPDAWISRTTLWATAAFIWTLQLWWSAMWLGRFRLGPIEWLWRCATYGRWEPIIKRAHSSQLG